MSAAMVNVRKKYIFLTAVILAASLMVGCRKQQPAGIADRPAGIELPLDSLYALLSPTYSQWEDAYLPMQISMQHPAQFQISGRTTMVRDSIIHISLRMMGMEIGAALLSPDSIWAVDKYHKIYVAESLNSLLSGVPISIAQLQDLLLGQAFECSDNLPDAQLWGEASIEHPCLLALHLLTPEAAADCLYDSQVSALPGMVAESCQLLVASTQQNWDLTWRWQMNGAKWNTNRKINFKIGDDYRRISAEALLQALKGL